MKRVGWPDVLRVLPGGETRSYVARAIRDAGFSLDCLPSKTAARATLAEALVRVEDQLETKRGAGSVETRAAVRQLRRALECEVWP